MPLPVITDCFRVALNWQASGLRATNVMHFLAPTLDEDDVYGVLDSNMTSDLWALVETNASIFNVTITKLDGTPDGREYINVPNAKWDGGLGTGLSPQVCELVKLLTGATGKRGRGRIYLPWVADSVVDQGVINSGDQATNQADWITWANAMAADGVALAVASYVGGVANQVLAIQVESRTATQRKRQPR